MADARRVDEYGNPVLRVDEYGNPIRNEPSAYGTGGHGTGMTGMHGGYGAGAGGHGTTQVHEGMTGGQYQPQRVEGHGTGTMGQVLRRSGSSSSSSSSEDDGMGGRRKKKGLKEKIKEKLPGGRKTDQAQTHTPTTTPVGTTGTTGTIATTTTTTTTTGTGQHYGEEHEKKGIMGKIKEKLPGGHH